MLHYLVVVVGVQPGLGGAACLCCVPQLYLLSYSALRLSTFALHALPAMYTRDPRHYKVRRITGAHLGPLMISTTVRS